ncbi:hypothetical protein JYT10_00725 [Beggiatoa alba]|nr:hypothetical protein [Beggiatoa alba]
MERSHTPLGKLRARFNHMPIAPKHAAIGFSGEMLTNYSSVKLELWVKNCSAIPGDAFVKTATISSAVMSQFIHSSMSAGKTSYKEKKSEE